jgi:hypothetical protein
VRAHILVCFLAYVLWKTLEQWQSRAGLGHSPHDPRRTPDHAPDRGADRASERYFSATASALAD